MNDLPVTHAAPVERADAARNRARILCAAARLFAERGVACTSMDAIAVEAGVGKGTLFRRFGDRATLVLTLLSEHEAAFQESFIRGPAPLGPGAPPVERVAAFGEALIDFWEEHGEWLLAADVGPGVLSSPPWQFYRLHLATLIREGAPELDTEVTADLLLSALSPRAVMRAHGVQGVGAERLKAGWRALVQRVLA